VARLISGTYYWYVKEGTDPSGGTFVPGYDGAPIGNTGDIPVVGDFNGDGISDPGIARNVGGTLYWYVKDGRYPSGSTFVINGAPVGLAGDVPIVGYFGGQ
jgi:hypothetical protein